MVVPSASFKVMIRYEYNIAVACALHNIFTGNRKLTVLHKRSDNVKAMLKLFCITTKR